MDPMRDLPMGFGMALLQNPQALQAYQALPPDRRQALLQQTHSIQSKGDMQALVDSLAHPGQTF